MIIWKAYTDVGANVLVDPDKVALMNDQYTDENAYSDRLFRHGRKLVTLSPLHIFELGIWNVCLDDFSFAAWA